MHIPKWLSLDKWICQKRTQQKTCYLVHCVRASSVVPLVSEDSFCLCASVLCSYAVKVPMNQVFVYGFPGHCASGQNSSPSHSVRWMSTVHSVTWLWEEPCRYTQQNAHHLHLALKSQAALIRTLLTLLYLLRSQSALLTATCLHDWLSLLQLPANKEAAGAEEEGQANLGNLWIKDMCRHHF